MNDPEVALMLAFAHGEEAAFVTLYRSYRDRMVAYCARLLSNHARGEEAAQDVFLKLHAARASYRGEARFSTFLYSIATRHCWNLRARLSERRELRSTELAERAVADAPDAVASISQRELRAALEHALGELPEKQSTALTLVHYEGLSYKEAAQVIDVSEGAVKSLIHRARTTLERELAPVMQALTETQHAV